MMDQNKPTAPELALIELLGELLRDADHRDLEEDSNRRAKQLHRIYQSNIRRLEQFRRQYPERSSEVEAAIKQRIAYYERLIAKFSKQR